MADRSDLPPRPDLPGAIPDAVPPVPPRSKAWPWLVGGVALLVVALVAIVVLASRGSPFRLPERIGEAARIEEGPFDVFIDSMIDYLAETDVEIDGASYGTPLDPDYILIVAESEGFLGGDVLAGFKAGYDSPGDEIQLDQTVDRDVGDTHFECAPTSDVTIPTTVCAWVNDRTVGMLISLVSDEPADSMPLIQQARSDAEA